MFPFQLKRTADQAALAGQITYIAARNGIFLHKRTPVFAASVKATELPMLQSMPQRIELQIPPLPAVHAAWILEFFREVHRLGRCSAAVLLWLDRATGRYRIQVPIQDADYDGFKYWPPDPKGIQTDGYICIGLACSQRFSGTLLTNLAQEPYKFLPSEEGGLILAYTLDYDDSYKLAARVVAGADNLVIPAEQAVVGLKWKQKTYPSTTWSGAGQAVAINIASRTELRHEIELPTEHAAKTFKVPHALLERVRVMRWDAEQKKMTPRPITAQPDTTWQFKFPLGGYTSQR